MKKRLLSLLILCLLTTSALGAYQVSPSPDGFRVDGQSTSLSAVRIEGYNYLKLRDLAMVLRGTKQQFSVRWDAGANAVCVSTNAVYTPVGGESAPIPAALSAAPAADTLLVDGTAHALSSYLMGRNHYYKLRDLAALLDFGVTWQNGVVLLDTAAHYIPDSPISPKDYQSLLGRGMDVDWSKSDQGRESYRLQTAQDFKAAGISHVRIRVKDPISDELFASLDRQIADCLSVGLIPIVAYQADAFKNDPSDLRLQEAAAWWDAMARHYQNASHKLAFDLLIECSDELNSQGDRLNAYFESAVSRIRASNPTRILMISPRLRADPVYLSELTVPTAHNGYLMAQWHFYASGPSKTNERKLWTTGTAAERRLIEEKIDLALAWQTRTGIPTWVGAWMPGNYNEGDDYTVPEQAAFAAFMVQTLTKAEIPFAVNSDTKFYDADSASWISEMLPVRSALFGA